jgi:hypothetical protein
VRLTDLGDALFSSEREATAPWLSRVWLAGLFAAGLVAWWYVIGWGSGPFDFHDWTVINLPRLTFLQNALRERAWPLHMTGTAPLHGVTDRFLALPDVVTSPQTLLLLILPVKTFVAVDVLIHYAAGFVGLMLLRRHFAWSLMTFAFVFVLFSFNGHILAHYSVGHFTWGPYFLFPYIAVLLLRFLDEETSARWVACFAVTMFYMVLAGGQHHFTWVLLLMALLVPFCRRRAWWLVAAAAASGLLSAIRLLPPVLELAAFRRAGLVSDVIGYPSISHVVTSLVTLRREVPAFTEGVPGNIWFFDSRFYEFTAFIGVAGLLFVMAGTYRWLRVPAPRYAALIVPLFAMIALSLGSVYRLVRAAGIPLLDSERYTSRLFILPLLLLIVFAATALDQWMKTTTSAWHRVLAVMLLAFTAIDMAGAIRLWRVSVSSGLFGPASFDAASAAIGNHADPAYINTVLAGAAVTMATAIVLLVLAYRDRPAARVHAS